MSNKVAPEPGGSPPPAPSPLPPLPLQPISASPLPPPPLFSPGNASMDSLAPAQSHTGALAPLKLPHGSSLRSSAQLDPLLPTHAGATPSSSAPLGAPMPPLEASATPAVQHPHTTRGIDELKAIHQMQYQSQVVHLPDNERPFEQFLPFRYPDMRNMIIRDHPDVFDESSAASDEERAKRAQNKKHFEKMCSNLSLRNTLRLAIDFGDAHDKYAAIDPDNDSELPDPEAPKEKGGGVMRGHDEQIALVHAFDEEIVGIFEKGEFEPVPADDLVKAMQDKSTLGLAVETADPDILDFKLFYRGYREKEVKYKKWWVFNRTLRMKVYSRLGMVFRLKRPVDPNDKAVGGATDMGQDNRGCMHRLFKPQVNASESLLQLRDEWVYLKLFKDVLRCDIDMLLPGSTVKFQWIDHLMIWGPILFGVGAAIWKAIQGTITFDGLMPALTSLALIVMPLTWGVKAYMAVKEKQRLYQAHLNKIYLLHNLNNNAGVISQLIDEAQEQEDNEAMLAYFFLWRGAAAPTPTPKYELDLTVEKYVQQKIDEANLSVRMDFEVTDAVSKLHRMGLMQEVVQEGGFTALQVVPVEEAAEKSNVKHFDADRETGHGIAPKSKSKRLAQSGSMIDPSAFLWRECMGTNKATGQLLKYYWNIKTGATQCQPPDEPFMSWERTQAAAAAEGVASGGSLTSPMPPPPTPGPAASVPPSLASPAATAPPSALTSQAPTPLEASPSK